MATSLKTDREGVTDQFAATSQDYYEFLAYIISNEVNQVNKIATAITLVYNAIVQLENIVLEGQQGGEKADLSLDRGIILNYIRKLANSSLAKFTCLSEDTLKQHNLTANLSWLKDYTSGLETSTSLTLCSSDEILGHVESALAKANQKETDVKSIKHQCWTVVHFMRNAFKLKGIPKSQLAELDARNRMADNLYKALDEDVDIESDIILAGFLEQFREDIIPKHLEPLLFYSRHIAFIQSSGSGKSRLVRGVGRYIPSFTVCFEREYKKGTSVPKPDEALSQFFRIHSEKYAGHIVAAAFLSALFQQLTIYIAKHFGVTKNQQIKLACDLLPSSLFYQLKGEPTKDIKLESEAEKLILRQMADQLAEIKQACEVTSETASTLDVAKCLYELRAGNSRFFGEKAVNDTERESILNSVNDQAVAILHQSKMPTIKEIIAEASLSLADHDARKRAGLPPIDHFDYVLASGLQDAIYGFFRVVDKLTTDRHTQFIFGADECAALEKLIHPHPYLQQGVRSFTRVFHRLEELAKSCDSTNAVRRVWLFTMDTRINTESLAPTPPVNVNMCWASDRGFQNSANKEYIWHSFGMDHAFWKDVKKWISDNKANDSALYFAQKSVSELMSFGHLKKMGRGIWWSHPTETLMFLATRKIVLDLYYWDLCNLLKQKYRYSNRDDFDSLTFTVASIRFNLDKKVSLEKEDKATQLIINAVAKHMRVFLGKYGDDLLQTGTPSEPILAIGAMFVLNYGRSFLSPYQMSVARGREEVNFKPWLNHISWENMLQVMMWAINNRKDVVDIGENGELIGRIVLTRARDCTLPDRWQAKSNYNGYQDDYVTITSLPYTTVRKFLSELMGKAEAESALNITEPEILNDYKDKMKAEMREKKISAASDLNEAKKKVAALRKELDSAHEEDESFDSEQIRKARKEEGEDGTIRRVDSASTSTQSRTREKVECDLKLAKVALDEANALYTSIKQRIKEIEDIEKCLEAEREHESDTVDRLIVDGLINFTHFVPDCLPVVNRHQKGSSKLLLWTPHLTQAWLRGAALICKENEAGIDVRIPILVRKKESAHKAFEDCTMSDHQITCIAARFLRTDGTNSSMGEWLYSPSLNLKRDDITSLAHPCPIIILMDLGLRHKPFDADVVGRLSDQAVASTCTMGKDYAEGEDTSAFLGIRIRGLCDAYPCMDMIDKDRAFQSAVDSTMTARLESYKPAPGSWTIPFRYPYSSPDSADCRSIYDVCEPPRYALVKEPRSEDQACPSGIDGEV